MGRQWSPVSEADSPQVMLVMDPAVAARPAVTFPASESHRPRPVPIYTAPWTEAYGSEGLGRGTAGIELAQYICCTPQQPVTRFCVILYTGWQWRNFFIPIYDSCSGRHDVGHGNVNTLQHLQSDRRSGASTVLFLNLPVQFYLNNIWRIFAR